MRRVLAWLVWWLGTGTAVALLYQAVNPSVFWSRGYSLEPGRPQPDLAAACILLWPGCAVILLGDVLIRLSPTDEGRSQ